MRSGESRGLFVLLMSGALAAGCGVSGSYEPEGALPRPSAPTPDDAEPVPGTIPTVDPIVETCATSSEFVVGAARADITGPVNDISTGYTEPGKTMQGLAMRLYARAFVIESPCSGKRVVVVNADVLHLYQSITTGVTKRLATVLPGVYDARNVMLLGTHTHSGTTNTSFRTLYNLANGVVGFDDLAYDATVDGIVDAIVRAHANRVPAKIHLARGPVSGAAHNRSAAAAAANGDAAGYASNIDDTMTLLRFTAASGRPIGLLNWFAVHGTSLAAPVALVHGDNKGHAAWRAEQTLAQGDGGPAFVAGFANSAMGDVSPNAPNPANPGGPFLRPSDVDPSLDHYDDARVHGDLQANVAIDLFAKATTPVLGGVEWIHRYVDFQTVSVDAAYGAPSGAKNCVAAVGAGFVSGTEEGGTALLSFLKEGDLTYNGIPIVPIISSDVRACHAEKQVVLPVGDVSSFWVDDTPWIDTITPFQLFTVGNVAVVASSFEQTTMIGRRVRRLVGTTLAPMGVTDVVVATIANSYQQYLTTHEEYVKQHFEGAFTLFGPWSGAAFMQETDRLARALVKGDSLDPGPTPPDLRDKQTVQTQAASVGVVNDAPPLGGAFGGVVTNAAPTYSKPNGRVVATFWSAHPRTVRLRQREGLEPASFTFLEVQRQLADGSWKTIATDADPFTRFFWTRTGGDLSPTSQVTIHWDLDAAQPGSYRILHHGVAKRTLLGAFPKYERFTGTSATFVVK